MAHFRAWCRTLILDTDEPWELEPFQAAFVRDLFAGKTVNWLIVPEGNAKTTLIAGLVLYIALHRERSRIVVAAAAKDQAFWLFDGARGFVTRSGLGPKKARTEHHATEAEPDTFRCFPGYKEIRVNESTIRVHAADDRTGDGAVFTFAILEELHRHRDLRLYRTWRGKAFKTGAQIVAISTAGEPDGEFEQVRGVMMQTGERTQKGAFTRVVSGTSVVHDWSLPEGCSPDRMSDVKKCNPLKAITIQVLREKYEDPAIKAAPFHWLRFVCNQPAFLDGAIPPITPEVWDAAAVEVGGLTEGERVQAAVRVGQQGGCSIGIAASRGDKVVVGLEHYPYSFPGLQAALGRLVSRYDVRAIHLDPRQHGLGADILEQSKLKLKLKETPQTPVKFMETSATFLGMLSAGNVIHDGDEELRKQAIGARMKESITGAYLEPSAETQGLIAVVIAAHEVAGTKRPKVHVWKGATA